MNNPPQDTKSRPVTITGTIGYAALAFIFVIPFEILLIKHNVWLRLHAHRDPSLPALVPQLNKYLIVTCIRLSLDILIAPFSVWWFISHWRGFENFGKGCIVVCGGLMVMGLGIAELVQTTKLNGRLDELICKPDAGVVITLETVGRTSAPDVSQTLATTLLFLGSSVRRNEAIYASHERLRLGTHILVWRVAV